MSVYNIAIEKKIPFTEVFFKTLAGKGNSFADALSVYDLAAEVKIPLSEEFFNILVEKGDNFEVAKSVYDLAIEKKITLTEEFFNNLVEKGESFEDAKGVYDLAIEKKISLTEKFMGSLLWQCRNSKNVDTTIEFISNLELKLSMRLAFNVIWKFEELENTLDFVEKNKAELIILYPKIGLLDDIQARQEVLIIDYISEIEDCRKCVIKLIVNVILNRDFELNVANAESLDFALKYFNMSGSFYYSEVRDRIKDYATVDDP